MSAAGLTAITDTFARQGYAVVRGLAHPDSVAAILSHLIRRAEQGRLNMAGDTQVPGSPSLFGDAEMDGLMEELRPAVEACTGLKLHPTYSYARLYRRGDALKPHRDREACEISVSLNLGQVPDDQPWALNVKGPAGSVAALLMPGDALLYRGFELTHWREPYEGDKLMQIFMHYVDQEGPYAGEKFDGRPALGAPPVTA